VATWSDAISSKNNRHPPETARAQAPYWLMGLANAVFGMYGGIMVISVPQLLSARHVPESTIAAMTAVMISPGFWAFLVSPMLDVRFSRRWYSVTTAVVAALLLMLALLNLDHLAWVEVLLLTGFLCANLYQSALGGWLSSIVATENKNKLSAWVTLGNIGGGGAMAVITGELMRNLSTPLAAASLGAVLLLPTAVFLWMPAPGPDRRLARESFSQFFGELARLFKNREVLVAILLFVAPAATFSLTNFLSGLGADFQASSHFVGLVGGSGVLLGGICGCLVFPLIDRLLPLRFLYLAIGAAGSLFTLALLLLPHTPSSFATALIGENVFQALAITASTAIAFETIGRANPLAATTYCLLISAFNIPISYMLFVDGAGYSLQGVGGSYAADAAVSLIAVLLLGALLLRLRRRRPLTAGSTAYFALAACLALYSNSRAQVTQTESNEYTRYELLAPETHSFKIYYEVSATTAGAKFYYNPIRKGSVASDESVYDAMLGTPLHFEVVSGAQARTDPLMPGADLSGSYIKVTLARPVPENGEGRVLIVKTYQDEKSYYRDGTTIVFNRPLSIRRNKVVLPLGYEIVGLTVASQIRTEQDGRLAISFLNSGAGLAPLEIKAVKDAQAGAAAIPKPPTMQRSWESPFAGETEKDRLSERAHQDREIVYFLQQPETHAFDLYHDYTESRAGVNGYANVVREGSVASHPSARVLDTGVELQAQEMSGAQMAASKIEVGEAVAPTARVVVIPFAAVKPGQSMRLRIAETYTAPQSYRLDGEDLVFDRSLGRPRNAVVLPTGWYCTFSAIPATVSQLPDGRVRLEYWNDRPEAVDVLLKARRRVGAR
jgi:MFS transporter, PAT family, beta-lactamase induction signal transducer AmpG